MPFCNVLILRLSYVDTKIFRVKEGFVIQGGDFIHNDGRGSESVYGGLFKVSF